MSNADPQTDLEEFTDEGAGVAPQPEPVSDTAAARLRGFIERVERLEEEKKNLADDIKEVFAEAKALGFDTKVMRKVISIRKKDQNDYAEEQAVLDTYLSALGMS